MLNIYQSFHVIALREMLRYSLFTTMDHTNNSHHISSIYIYIHDNSRKSAKKSIFPSLLAPFMSIMSISEIQLVIFGDSYSDGGYLGQGIAALDRSDAHRDPMEDVLYAPLQKIAEYFGSKIYMKELGFYEGCATDGLPWPYHVGVKKVMNFACGGSTTCQYVEKLVEVPPGYVAMPSVGSMAGYEYHHRGIAQQIQWAAATLPQEIWSDPKTWIILGPLSNDVIYHGAQAIGSTTSEACRCPFVQNHRQMLEDLANLGVTSDRIISCGLIPLDLLPGLQGDLDLVWFRAQQEAVNRCLDAMLKHPRWPLDKLIRGLWSEAPAVKLG